jgi:hypothetical protein
MCTEIVIGKPDEKSPLEDVGAEDNINSQKPNPV